MMRSAGVGRRPPRHGDPGLVGVIGIVFAEPVIGILRDPDTLELAVLPLHCSEGSLRLIASGWC